MAISNPSQTVLVSCRGNTIVLGENVLKENIIAIDWHMPLSFEPSLYAISIGKKRFSQGLIHDSGCFAVNFMPYELKDAVLFCGTNRGELINKFEKTGLTSVECSKISCPRIGEALAYFECQIIKEFEIGDHILFIANIVEAGGEKKKGKRLLHLDGNKFTTTQE